MFQTALHQEDILAVYFVESVVESVTECRSGMLIGKSHRRLIIRRFLARFHDGVRKIATIWRGTGFTELLCPQIVQPCRDIVSQGSKGLIAFLQNCIFGVIDHGV